MRSRFPRCRWATITGWLCLSLLSIVSVQADSLDNWTSQHLATSNILTGVTYGNGTYVVVGYNGEIQTSPNLVNWTHRPFSATMRFLALNYANGVFVGAGGATGATVQTSTDGITWTQTTQSPYCNYYNASTFTNNKYIVGGDNSNVGTSADGYSWTGPNIRGGSAYTIYGVAYGNGAYVVALNGGTIWTSPNTPSTGLPMFVGGPNPLKTTGTTNDLLGVAFGNGIFVAVGVNGAVVTSPDGSAWTVRSSGTTNSLYGVAFANGVFVAVGSSGTIITSPDGVTWTGRSSGTTNQLRGVTFANDRFIAVGVDGTVTVSGTTTSTNGVVGNISTRGLVQTGNDAMIAGVIIQSGAKKILVRAAGPSLAAFGINNALANPTLELRDSNGGLLASNDDWQNTQVSGIITGSQANEIQQSGLAPSDPKEPAIIATLAAGAYTAIVQGTNGGTGVGVVQVYGLP